VLRRDARDVGRFDLECDVLVVGFGCAGACAAIEAAAAGARVLVVERSGGPGGTSINSGGFLYLGGGTALQKALGYEDSAENMFRYMMAACGPAPDEALIAPYCEGSAGISIGSSSRAFPIARATSRATTSRSRPTMA
jgi:3-oxo-5alpha-steroid 4-dehydrogenase